MSPPGAAVVMAMVTGLPLDVPSVTAAVRGDGDGAVCVFTGHIRNRSQGQAVTRLDYEVYTSMAERELGRIGREVLERSGASRIALVHRSGSLAVGEVAVVVAASAPHREAAFHACRLGIEAVKTEVPIWKREHRADGAVWPVGHPGVEGDLAHFDDAGRVRMVDVSSKSVSSRVALAAGEVRCRATTISLLTAAAGPKGQSLETARIAGIMAAKRTADLIPLCHPLAITHVAVELEPEPARGAIQIRATVRCSGPTGVEMEALTAVTVTALTLVDMAKSADRWMTIDRIRLLRKQGGSSGVSVRPEEAGFSRGAAGDFRNDPR